MKYITMILIAALALVGCKNEVQYPMLDIEYSIRQYLLSEMYTSHKSSDFTVRIDSIVPFPKHEYIEESIMSYRRLIKDYEIEPNGNEIIQQVILQSANQLLDSAKLELDNTKRIEKHYRCYTHLMYTENDEYKFDDFIYILNENFVAIDFEFL